MLIQSLQKYRNLIFAITMILVSGDVFCASTFTVSNANDSGTGSLRQAVIDANLSIGTDVIKFSSDLRDTIILTGEHLVISESVTIAGDLSFKTYISGGGNSRIFFSNNSNDITLTLNDLVLSGGFSDSPGGAIGMSGIQMLILNRTLVSGNSVVGSSSHGGGIFVGGDVILNQSKVAANSVIGNDFAIGGGLYIQGNIVLNNSSVEQNHVSGKSTFGGGLQVQGDITLNNSTIWGNSANSSGGEALGGGISVISRQHNYVDGNITLNQSTISGNSVISANPISQGGGIHLSILGDAIFNQSTITNNSSNVGAGGLTSNSSSVSIVNTILSGNVGPEGNFEDLTAGLAEMNVRNSLFGDSETEITGINVLNIISDIPDLRPLRLNGGATRTHVPYPDSPVRDMGNNQDANSFSYDQRGSGYLRVLNGTVDIGSVEREASPAIVAISPSGTIDTSTPTFSWYHVSGFQKYAIRVMDASNGVIFSSVTPNNLVCPLGICSFIKQGLVFPGETASWQVRIEEADGTNGEWSSPMSFTVTAEAKITIAIPLTPSGNIETTTPTFTWTAALGFNKYALRGLDATGNVVFSGVTPNYLTCPMSVCSYTVRPGVNFPDGLASWQVRTEAADGSDGSWSQLLGFTVLATGKSTLATPLFPLGSIFNEVPVFSWTASPGFSKYAIRLQDTLGNVTFSGVTPNLFCPNDVCEYLIPVSELSDGDYAWRVRTEAYDGTNGFWSDLLNFKVISQE